MSTKAKPKQTRRAIDRPRQPGAPYTIPQAAEVLNLAPRTVRALCASGQLKSYRDGPRGGRVRISEAALAEYLEGRQGTPERERGTGLTTRRHLKPVKARRRA